MTVIAVKKYCAKKGKVYGPYPKDPEVFYLYRVYRDGDEVKQRYLGKGVRPKDSVVQEKRPISVVQEPNCLRCRHLTTLDRRPFCNLLQAILAGKALRQPCPNFEEGKL